MAGALSVLERLRVPERHGSERARFVDHAAMIKERAPTTLSRRESLLAFAVALATGCAPRSENGFVPKDWEPRSSDADAIDTDLTFADSVDAAFETILPAERDAQGRVVVPGAREAGADRVLSTEGFGLYALAQGFVPGLPDRVVSLLERAGDAFRIAANAELDALAALRRPLVAFRDLPADLREEVLAGAFDDPARKGTVLVLRAAVFAAYLGAITSDVGLRAVGFPKFEDWSAHLAVSGYPRTKKDGRLLDPAKDDLAAIAQKGDLDDYTYALAPEPTPGDDLSLVLDANGDLR